jgi:hypothetical protein
MIEAFDIEVAFARSDVQSMVTLRVPQGTTALEAVLSSGLAVQFGEIDPESAKLGIFGKVVAPDTVLRPGDRVEIYRPLLADPKEVRRRRALASKK